MKVKIPSKLKFSPKLVPPTSYLPTMAWLIKWITRSYALPIKVDTDLTFILIKGSNLTSIMHYFTLFLTLMYPITFSVWLYVSLFIFSDKENLSATPLWANVFYIYYFTCYIGLGLLQYLLHFRASELILLLKGATWIEKICLGTGE